MKPSPAASARILSRATLLLVPALVLARSALATAPPSNWRIAKDDLTVVCPMTVGGSFEAKTTSLTGSVVEEHEAETTLRGVLSVDLRTLDTGIEFRNRHLRDYLEVGKGEGFDHATLTDIRLGTLDLRTFHGKTPFHGDFLLHGVKRSIEGEAEIQRAGAAVRVVAVFTVPLHDYAISEPRYLGVGVKNEVRVKVVLTAEPGGGSAEAVQ